MQVTAFGALLGLGLAIVLILRKHNPAYSLMFGALLGGLIGGATLAQTVAFMIGGAKAITPAVLRILTAGVLAGVLIETGAAGKIAEAIVENLGEERALLALAVATLILTAVGVFVDVAVITVAPVALVVAQRAELTKMAILCAMVGGGKAGNVISPNPNTISLSSAFKVPLSSLMAANIVPAIFGLLVTYFLSKRLIKIGDHVLKDEVPVTERELPSLLPAMTGPLLTITLLALRPLAGIEVDPLIALPAGGIVGCLVMGKMSKLDEYVAFGLSKMSPVAILLIGTGTVAGVIQNSALKDLMIGLLKSSGLPAYLLAPTSGAIMSAATASTTAGATVAGATFASAIVAVGVKALAGAAMIHTGATILDHLPHGSFFHATGGAIGMTLENRLRLLPYETLVGFTLALVSTIQHGVLG